MRNQPFFFFNAFSSTTEVRPLYSSSLWSAQQWPLLLMPNVLPICKSHQNCSKNLWNSCYNLVQTDTLPCNGALLQTAQHIPSELCNSSLCFTLWILPNPCVPQEREGGFVHTVQIASDAPICSVSLYVVYQLFLLWASIHFRGETVMKRRDSPIARVPSR